LLQNNANNVFSILLKFLAFSTISVFSCNAASQDYPALTTDQKEWLADQIYRNECNRNPDCLTAWNSGENFPSMGIGHFIWYPRDRNDIYEESFPALMTYMLDHGISIPAWIMANNLDAPWDSRQAFLADQDSERLRNLRLFLQEHKRLQLDFIVSRFDSALADIMTSIQQEGMGSAARQELSAKLHGHFYAVANASPPHGLYALIDYVNFKGTGVSPHEAYNGRGWGLKQVLLEMESSDDPLAAFISSARTALARRVDNAPPERNEGRWLEGWYNRLTTYQP